MKNYFIGFIIVSFFNVVSLKFFSNFLTLEEFGVFSYLQSFFIIISSFFSKFLSQAIFKFYNQYKNDNALGLFLKGVAKYLLLFFIIISAMYVGLAYGINDPLVKANMVPLLLLSFCLFFIDIQNAYLQTTGNSKFFILTESIRSLLKCILPIALYLAFDKSFYAFMSGFLISHAITPLLFIVRYRFAGKLKSASGVVNKLQENQIIKSMLHYSYAISVWYLLIQLLNYVDRIILFKILSGNTIAIYAANFSIFTFASQFIGLPLISTLHPLFLKYDINRADEKQELQLLLTKHTNQFIILQLTFSCVIAVFYKEITLLFLKGDYVLNFNEIFILLAGFSLWNLGSYGNKVFETYSKTSLMLLALLICTILYIPVLFINLNFLGEKAIFISKAIMYILYPVVQIIINRYCLAKGSNQVKWTPDFKKAILIIALWYGFYILLNFTGLTDTVSLLQGIAYKSVPVFIFLLISLFVILGKKEFLNYYSTLKGSLNGIFK